MASCWLWWLMLVRNKTRIPRDLVRHPAAERLVSYLMHCKDGGNDSIITWGRSPRTHKYHIIWSLASSIAYRHCHYGVFDYMLWCHLDDNIVTWWACIFFLIIEYNSEPICECLNGGLCIAYVDPEIQGAPHLLSFLRASDISKVGMGKLGW